MRQEKWVRFLAWMEIIGGALGLLGYIATAIAYAHVLPVWHNLLAVAFFGTNIIAGLLLLEGRNGGMGLSFFIQLVQVVYFSGSIAWIARAGLHLTPVIASTGAGVFAGPAAEFMSYPTTAVTFNAVSGLGLSLKLGIFLKPLAEARFALGVNLVAAYFAISLWNALGRATERSAAELDLRGMRRWSLPATYAIVGFVAFFMLVSGPKAVNPRHPRWLAETGDTLEILNYTVQYEAMLNAVNKSVSQDRFLLVQFSSDLGDTARDRANAIALAQMTCRVADSVGVKRIVVSPTRRLWLFFRFSRSYAFPVDTATHCKWIS